MDRPANVRAQVFLVLFPAAVGCLLGSLVIDAALAVTGFGVAALTVALVASLVAALSPVSGIRKPLRSYRFLNGASRSPLSRQGLMIGLFTILLVIHWALVLAGSGSFGLGIATAVVGGGAILAVGLTYRLKSQPGWRHWSTLASLFGGAPAVGVAAALVIATAWPDSLPAGSSGMQAAQALVVAGAAVLALGIVGRSVYLIRGGAQTREVWTLTQGTHSGEYFAVPVLVIVTLVAAAVSFAWPWAIIIGFLAALAAQFLQWRLFFVTGVPLSWRSEVAWSLPPHTVGKEG